MSSSQNEAHAQANLENQLENHTHSSTHSTNPVNETHCWICLGTVEETLPYQTEPGEFLVLCKCSLTAHKSCLVRWIVSVKKKKLNMISGSKLVYSQKCPQCQAPIYMVCESSKLNMISSIIEKSMKKAASWGFGLAAITIFCSITIASTSFFFSAVGIEMFNEVVPPKIQGMVFGINREIDLYTALSQNLIPARDLLGIPSIPLYLITFRMDIYRRSLSFIGIPLLYLQSNSKIPSEKDPCLRLLMLMPGSFVYNAIFKLFFNGFYYDWCTSIEHPIAGGNDICDFIMTQKYYEKDYKKDLDAKYRELIQKAVPVPREKLSSFAKLKAMLVGLPIKDPEISEEISTISRKKAILNRSIWLRRWGNILRYDFSAQLVSRSVLVELLTTYFWPKAGVMISNLILAPIPYFNYIDTTPELSHLCRNLIGCFLAAIVKDLFNLGRTWLKIQELRNVSLMGPKSADYHKITELIEKSNNQ